VVPPSSAGEQKEGLEHFFLLTGTLAPTRR
jgi:hypothetical protein